MIEIDYDGPTTGNVPKKPGKPGGGKIPPLRTYRGDVDDLMRRRSITKTDIVVAEQKRRETHGEEHDHTMLWRAVGVVVGLFFLILGITAYTFFGVGRTQTHKTSNTTVTPTKAEQESDTPVITITDNNKAQFGADTLIAIEARGDSLSPQEIEVQKDGDRVNIETFLPFLSPRVPALVLKGREYTYGVHGRGKSAFIKISGGSYPTLLASMLAWEEVMVEDLLPVLEPRTPSTIMRSYSSLPFVDGYTAKTDTRSVKNSEGKVVFIYGFPKRDLVVITTNIETYAMVVETLRATD